jgi:hypothetical protein
LGLARHLGHPSHDRVALVAAEDQQREFLPDSNRLVEVAYSSSRARRAQPVAILIL